MANTERHVLLPSRARLAGLAAMAPWLARGDRLADVGAGFVPAVSTYFGGQHDLAVAALLRQLVAGDAGTDPWLCADPAWVQPEVNGARLLACGDELAVTAAEAAALRPDLEGAFAAHGFAFHMADAAHWQLRLPAGSQVPAFAGPDQARGADLFDHLPAGQEGRRWRAVLGEVQITLHNHGVNAARRERGVAPLNSVWFWGAGVLPDVLESGLTRVFADDLLLWAVGARADVHVEGLDACAAQATPFELVDLSAQQDDAIAARWWPLLEAGLAGGHTQRLVLIFAGGERWALTRAQRLRFWRRGA